VDSLRLEQQIHNNIKAKLMDDIEKFVKQSEQVIEDTNAAYCAKDKAASDLVHLKSIADREYSEFQREWKELNRTLDNDRKVHEYLSRPVIGEQTKATLPLPVEPTPQSAPTSPRSIEINDCYATFFERIKESIGLIRIDDLLSKYTCSEILNFSHFNQLNELINQTDRMTAKVMGKRDELLALKVDGETLMGIHTTSTLSPQSVSLSGRIKHYAASMDELGRRWSRIENKVRLIESKCFGNIESESVSEGPRNILHVLGEIEEYIDPLLSKYAAEFGVRPSRVMKGKNRRIANLPSSISPSEDDETRPLFRDELVAIVNKRQQQSSNSLNPSIKAGLSRSHSAASTRPSTSNRPFSRRIPATGSTKKI
jgi:hypothetical protein